MNEIEHAAIAHSSISEELRNSPVVLTSTPNPQILHTLASVPPIDDRADDWTTEFTELLNEWYKGGDHYLLMRMMEEGSVPRGWRERMDADHPRTTSSAYKVAQKRGYSVPNKFLHQTDVSYSERNAFHAAFSIATGYFDPFWSRTLDREALASFKKSLGQLTGQFIVPDPLEEWKSPYLVDQLWIAISPDRKVRLMVLEIDGEVHLDPQQQKRDKKRDVMLAAMGYEVYHAAGWWCRIDPYRVICEFLSASGLFPNAHKYLLGSHFRIIADYVCDWCHEPLCRWDDNWIQEVWIRDEDYQYRDSPLVVHRCCAERAYEELSY